MLSLPPALTRHQPFQPDTSGGWEPRAKRLGPKASTLTPRFHQTRLLREPSSTQEALSPEPHTAWNGRLFSGGASGLDAFSPYPQRRGCPAVPCRTTGRLLAAASRSSRTRDPFPSGGQHPQQIESDLSHDGLNPAHVPL